MALKEMSIILEQTPTVAGPGYSMLLSVNSDVRKSLKGQQGLRKGLDQVGW